MSEPTEDEVLRVARAIARRWFAGSGLESMPQASQDGLKDVARDAIAAMSDRPPARRVPVQIAVDNDGLYTLCNDGVRFYAYWEKQELKERRLLDVPQGDA